jgi:MoaA/NifB/PqqE/SkfB family radical SAM enzyme
MGMDGGMMQDIILEEVHLESSTYCDAACIFCPQKDVTREGEMQYDLFMKIVDEAVDLGCEHFTPFRANEPLQFYRLFEWLVYFRYKKVKAIIFTNGNNLDPVIANGLLEYSDVIHSITFSFHGGTPEIYRQNMGLDFTKVSNNIIYFMNMKPVFPVHIFCMKRSTTVESIDAFLDFWNQVENFTSVGIRGTMEWAGDRPDDMTLDIESANRIPCSRVLRQLDVAYNGDVCLCCVDAHNQIVFGNLYELTIEEILNNRLRKWYVEQHQMCNFNIPLCDSCSINIG